MQEILTRVLFIVAAIAGIVILLAVVTNLNKMPEYKTDLVGPKLYILQRIAGHVEKCYEQNFGKLDSVVCLTFTYSSDGSITAQDIVNAMDKTKVDTSKIQAEDIGLSGKAIVRYENKVVYITKTRYDRVDS